MEEERDLVTFSDDEGNEFELEVIDYFDHEDQEYAVLVDPQQADQAEEDASELEVYIMKIVVDGEYEEFLPADDDKLDVLSAIVEERMAACDDDECDCDECECEEGECKEHDHECSCGCHKED